MKQKKFSWIVLIFLLYGNYTFSQQQKIIKHENVVYGMVAGAALLMDIYQPENSNHKGIIVIPGSAYGFVYDDVYDQEQLKNDYFLDTAYLGKWAQILSNKGYTIFVINHRFAPAFKYNAIIADCRRAVRFVRFNAEKYSINPLKLGAFGHSSGASLAALLGVSDTTIKNSVSDIDKLSSKVQAVVTLAAPFDLSDFNKREDTSIENSFDLKMILSFMGSLPDMQADTFMLSGEYAFASPIAHVTKDDAPMMIFYSDNDPLIPPRQAKNMYNELMKNNVPAKIFMSHGTGHTPLPDMNEIDQWFQKYLE
ncbi:MAG: alpha/beta hydrolase [Chitinophagaceae bacterium]